MRNLFLSLIMITTLASSITWAQAPEDQPAPDEAFSSFFARITHGGSFPGIRFDAPVDFQEFFLTRIRRGNWVASLYQARKQITNAGGDLWNSFYKAEKIGNLLFPTTELNQKFQQAYDSFISTQCQRGCRPWNTLQQISFSQWTAGEREAFALSYVTKAAVFKDRTVLDFLGDRYEMKSEEVNGRFRFELLNDQDFKKAVKDLGWTGEIYFRGITIPDPKNPQSRIILMNDDSIKAQTTYQAPLLQALEYVGILTHEISHVFQDRESTKLGLDLEIRSAEGALLIEGGAEFEAEQALITAAQSWPTLPQALNLFVGEAAVEVVYRPGNEQTGNLFPYTVGLPFVAALDDEFHNSQKLRFEMYKTILNQETLVDMFKNLGSH